VRNVYYPKVAIVLAATKGLSGQIIRWASDSKVNHAMLVCEDTLWSGFWSAEAIPKHGVARLPFDPNDPRYLEMDCFVFHGDSAKGLLDLRHMIGADYDYAGAAIGTLRLVFKKLLGTKSDVSIHDHNKFFCFEFVIRFLHGILAEGAECLVPENTSPAALRTWLMEHKDFRRRSVAQFMEASPNFRSLGL
jgi:hypothetical protein